MIEKYGTLCERVARRLTRRKDIVIRWRKPYIIGAAGIALHNGKTGYAVVDVDPDLSEDEKLSVLLHELAHVKHDWKMIPANNWADLAPASVQPIRGHFERNTGRPHESAADRQAAEWLEYAKQNAKRYTQAANPTEAKLTALAAWLEPELQTIIDQAVKNAVLEFTQKDKKR